MSQLSSIPPQESERRTAPTTTVAPDQSDQRRAETPVNAPHLAQAAEAPWCAIADEEAQSLRASTHKPQEPETRGERIGQGLIALAAATWLFLFAGTRLWAPAKAALRENDATPMALLALTVLIGLFGIGVALRALCTARETT